MIRKATEKDFDFIYGLYMHPESNPYLLYEQMDENSFDPIFKSLLDKGVLYVYENENQQTGMVKLAPQLHRNAHIVYLGGLAIHPDFSGKGAGFQMLEEVKSFAKENNYLRIELTVAVSNEKAIRLYEKAGFIKEGVLKKYTLLKRENRFIDEAIMACLF